MSGLFVHSAATEAILRRLWSAPPGFISTCSAGKLVAKAARLIRGREGDAAAEAFLDEVALIRVMP